MRWPRAYRSVALVGIDGSGKSTQAELLRRLIAGQAAKRVFSVHPFGRKLLRVGVRSPILPSRTAGELPKKSPGILSRLVVVADVMDIALYLWLVHARAAFVALLGGKEVWLVGDRSMDDVLIKHWSRGTLSKRTAILIRSLVPHFGTTVWLEIEPRVAMGRDGDFELAYYEELYAAYSTAARWFGWRVVRQDSRDRQAVHESIVKELAPFRSSSDVQDIFGRRP